MRLFCARQPPGSRAEGFSSAAVTILSLEYAGRGIRKKLPPPHFDREFMTLHSAPQGSIKTRRSWNYGEWEIVCFYEGRLKASGKRKKRVVRKLLDIAGVLLSYNYNNQVFIRVVLVAQRGSSEGDGTAVYTYIFPMEFMASRSNKR